MAKNKVIYCWECGKNTVHTKVCAAEQGVERAALAVFTVGWSEVFMEHYWQCSKCGELRKR